MNASFVYIVTNRRHGALFTGVTDDLEALGRRNQAARASMPDADCNVLVWWEAYGDARDRQARMKRWPREGVVALIEASNPDWVDLWPELVG